MRERSKYHFADIANLIIFYSIFACFFVALILGTISFIKGELPLSKFIFRIAFLVLMFIPFAIKKIFNITFSRLVSSLFYIFMFFSAFLGGVLDLYSKFAAWDMIIHFIMGLLLSLLSIYLLNLTVYKKDRSRHNLFFTFVFMVLFSMGIGALWEIWEFCGDLLFNLGAQRYIDYAGNLLVGQKAILDTMLDLCMDLLGAITGVLTALLCIQINKHFLKTFVITKLKHKQEIEDIEE